MKIHAHGIYAMLFFGLPINAKSAAKFSRARNKLKLLSKLGKKKKKSGGIKKVNRDISKIK